MFGGFLRSSTSALFSVSRTLPRTAIPTRLAIRLVSSVSRLTDTLYIANLPYNMTDDDVRYELGSFGAIKNVKMGVNSNGIPMGYAHVTFESQECAERLFKSHQEEPFVFGTRQARIELSIPSKARETRESGETKSLPTRTLYVGNLPYNMTEDDIRYELSSFGEILRVQMGMNSRGLALGFAHVEFVEVSQAMSVFKAHEEQPFVFGGRQTLMDYGKPSKRDEKRGPSDTLFIGGFPDGAEAELREAASKFGRLMRVHVAYDAEGKSRRFAHVQFSQQESAERAFEHFMREPLVLDGLQMNIDFQETKNPAPKDPNQKLYFYDFIGDEKAMREMLGPYAANVVSVYFLRNNYSEKANAGFIHMSDVESATDLMEKLNGTRTGEGTTFKLEYARRREFDKPRSPRRSFDDDEMF
ncbi:uncharacterized protein BT62DRAFT_973347 [Guyanagaster necrorhizus]|uniref:RRM domain-containing protein n=1 Tax=Guyanagaster necrorhizus TaxID=856835 RepID=A0A9P7VMN4_9AGAR|nr:uncharacterized protein BT62DRAFT_973347 [Guyanagaster necrorhizus MCA 3950]KAG7442694.1 hypothetical protein BT62DRAFT_973347 [Guyanagaster necrorhizus MCA 3950]